MTAAPPPSNAPSLPEAALAPRAPLPVQEVAERYFGITVDRFRKRRRKGDIPEDFPPPLPGTKGNGYDPLALALWQNRQIDPAHWPDWLKPPVIGADPDAIDRDLRRRAAVVAAGGDPDAPDPDAPDPDGSDPDAPDRPELPA